MRILSPMSQDDEAERRHDTNDNEYDDGDHRRLSVEEERMINQKWRRKLEAAMVKMTAEMAALREQVSTGREWRVRKSRTLGAWLAWIIWMAVRHLFMDALILGLILIWMRKRKDRRLEDLVRQGLKLGREYARRLLPSR